MASLWFVPTAVLTAGAGLIWWSLRRIASAADDVRGEAQRMQGLSPKLVPIRVEAERARRTIDRLDHR